MRLPTTVRDWLQERLHSGLKLPAICRQLLRLNQPLWLFVAVGLRNQQIMLLKELFVRRYSGTVLALKVKRVVHLEPVALTGSHQFTVQQRRMFWTT